MKYLILGDGKLGTELQKQTKWDYISRKKDGIDFTKEETYKNKLEGYDVVINCIGYTKTYENEQKLNWELNVKGVITLVNICNYMNIKLVHISTDYVYANSIENASEEDVPSNFNTWYSYTKLLGDGYIQAISNNYLLLRTNFKPKPFPWKTAWDNIKGNFDYIDVISKLIIKLIENNAIGIYNVGTKTKTYYELAKQTLPECIKNNNGFNHPTNVTMNLTKLDKC